MQSNMTRQGVLSSSYRRWLLDEDLTRVYTSLQGVVLDLGGEWLQRRGTFRPPRGRQDLHWICLNIDREVAPDIIADIASVPVGNHCVDVVLCTEVLEHVPQPEVVLRESGRILKPNGLLILSVPFLYRIHADPYDYQRLTAYQLKRYLSTAGFENVNIKAQGYYFTVLADMVRGGVAQLRPAFLRWGIAAGMLPLLWLCLYLDKQSWVSNSSYWSSYTTGYFVTATRKSVEVRDN
jgi:SAM-dependent methyltransferase